MLCHVLTLPCNGRRHYGFLQLYIPRFQNLQNLLSKSSIKMHITVKNFRQLVVHFQNRLQLLQMFTSFPVAI